MTLPSDRQYGPLGELPVRTFARRWKYDALAENFSRAQTIMLLHQVPPDALLKVDVQPPDGTLAVESLLFRRSPAPELSETEWLQITRDNVTRRVVLHGAYLDDGLVNQPGSIKAGVPFGFYSVDIFRSRPETSENGRTMSAMPPPEAIDPYILSVCRGMGMVTEAIDGQLWWRLPLTYYETGPVLDAKWMIPGSS